MYHILRYMATHREERAKAANAPHNMHNVVNFLLKVKKFVNIDQELFFAACWAGGLCTRGDFRRYHKVLFQMLMTIILLFTGLMTCLM